MKLAKLFGIALVFVLGITAGLYLATAEEPNWEDTPESALLPFNPFQTVDTQPSPKDRVAEKQIEVYSDRIILDIQNAQWARFTDTKSMEPIIHSGSNAIEIVPQSEDDIQVGDIVSYESDYTDGFIIHRVVYKGEDEEGIYFILKGDNLATSDPGRVRFDQIQRVVVAIIY